MANYNKVILAGNLTRDPQLSYLPSQAVVCEFGLAINRTWKDKEGAKKESACFVDCKAFGKQAETINQYLRKGRGVLVDGRLDFSQWEDKEGQKRSKLRVVVENFQFVGGQEDKPESAPAAKPDSTAPAAEYVLYDAANPDEIPF